MCVCPVLQLTGVDGLSTDLLGDASVTMNEVYVVILSRISQDRATVTGTNQPNPPLLQAGIRVSGGPDIRVPKVYRLSPLTLPLLYDSPDPDPLPQEEFAEIAKVMEDDQVRGEGSQGRKRS